MDKKSKWQKYWLGETVRPVIEVDLAVDPEEIDFKVDLLDRHPVEVGEIEEGARGRHLGGEIRLQDVVRHRDADHHQDVLQGDLRDGPGHHLHEGGHPRADPRGLQVAAVGIQAPVLHHQVQVKFVNKQKCTKIVKYRISIECSEISLVKTVLQGRVSEANE